MGYQEAHQVLTTFFKTGFVSVPGGTKFFDVEYPNYPLQEGMKVATRPWGRFSILSAPKIAREVGIGSNRIVGAMTLQIFLPEDTGTVLGRTAGDRCVQFVEFADISITNGIIRMREVSLRELPNESGWARMNIEMPFFRDETYFYADIPG